MKHNKLKLITLLTTIFIGLSFSSCNEELSEDAYSHRKSADGGEFILPDDYQTMIENFCNVHPIISFTYEN